MRVSVPLLLEPLFPLRWEHIAFNGDYVWPAQPSGPCEIPAPSSSTPLSVLFREDSAMTPAWMTCEPISASRLLQKLKSNASALMVVACC